MILSKFRLLLTTIIVVATTPFLHAQTEVTIENPGFEDGFTGWDDTDPSAASNEFNTGSKSAKISGAGGKFEQTVSVSSSTDYTLTAYVKGSGTIGAIAGSDDYSESGDFSGWDQLTVTFNSGSNTSVTIYGAYYQGEGRFDDFVLTSDSDPVEEEEEEPEVTALNPSDILGLTKWKITYPLDEDGDDSSDATHYDNRNNQAHEMEGAEIEGEIAAPYDEYFYVSGDEVRFKAHVGGATTSGSGYPRSELRQLVGGNSNYWSMDEFQYLDVRVRATNLPDIKPEVSMVQIHGPDDEPLRVEYREDDQGLHVTQNETITVEDVLPYALGEQLRVTVIVDAGDITCTIINESRPEEDPWTDTWTAVDETGYFKVGCYTQSSSVLTTFKSSYSVNPDPEEYGEVAAKDLTLIETYQNTDGHNITSFAVTNQVGVTLIDVVNHTVQVEVPFGTDLTSISPTITVSDGAVISPVSGVSQDFSSPVIYTITDSDDETQDWTVTVVDAVTWDGSVWSNMHGPSAFENVRIKSDYTCSAEGIFGVKNLEIESGTTLTVDGNVTLIVEEDLSVNGSLVIASGASIITYEENTITGNDIIFKRNTRYSGGKYSMVGSPMQQSSSITGSDLGSFVYQYDETEPFGDDGLENWVDASAEQLIPGRGYTQAFQQELVFEGQLNEGTITYSGTYSEDTDDDNEGWNLVSNPYASAISVSDFISHNDNIEGAVYLWDDNGSNTERGSNSDYVVANGTAATNTTPAGGHTRFNQMLGSAQGFFVKLNDNSDTEIEFTESMREEDSNKDDHFFRQTETAIVRLNLTDANGLFRQAVLALVEGASASDLIRAYDAPLYNPNTPSAIYTLKSDKKLAIQSQPFDWQKVSLGLNIDQIGMYAISVEGDENVFLRDTQTGVIIDLQKEEYTFLSTQAGVVSDRFILLSSHDVLDVRITETLTEVYASGHRLYFNHQEGAAKKQYQMVSLTGQAVQNFMIDDSTSFDLSHLKRGIYIVTDGVNPTKVFITK